eukprot:CAMPEP_0113442734 /NCGR_PEP_ID=MMETSP0014_2-20120614/1765_1 /TAXON_ID=2857 /ORGANISM="Nitzschia sp." /LENGTH=1402 /DNA_ID=CAMNT_0000333647 /DNA_START=669 /DNA_END=4874 /DNA_ORIENTATION=+ /assembly_acc=CAM_ASM_000159
MSSSGRRPSRGGGGSGRGGGRRGRGGGGGSGGRGNRSSTSSSNANSSPSTRNNNNSHSRRTATTNNNTGVGSTTSSSVTDNSVLPTMKDEEVLIGFMPYLKGDNREAMTIHERYQSNNDYSSFLQEAREFLGRERGSSATNQHSSSYDQSSSYATAANATVAAPVPQSMSYNNNDSNTNVPPPVTRDVNGMGNVLQQPPQQQQLHQQQAPPSAFINSGDQTLSMESMEQKMANLLSDDDDRVAMPRTMPSSGLGPSSNGISGTAIIGGGTISSTSTETMDPTVQSLLFPSSVGQRSSNSQSLPIGSFGQQQSHPQQSFQMFPQSNMATTSSTQPLHHQQQHHQQQQDFLSQQFTQGQPGQHDFSLSQQLRSPSMPPRRDVTPQRQGQGMTQSPQFSMFSSSNGTGTPIGVGSNDQSSLFNSRPLGSHETTRSQNTTWSTPQSQAGPPGLSSPSNPLYLQGRPRTASESSKSPKFAPIGSPVLPSPQIMAAPQQSGTRVSPTPLSLSSGKPSESTPGTKPVSSSATPGPEANNATAGNAIPARTPKKEFVPKRLWTHVEDQPGKIIVNDIPSIDGNVLHLHPRQELTARWMLPLSFFREVARVEKDRPANTLFELIQDILQDLSLGLFRRGCIENGSQASIVSKEVLLPVGASRNNNPFQVTKDMVVGSIPFYSPRTPGHVIFRMYWRERPVHTLATGPTLNVRVTEGDFESAIRFILSNFKSKKVNPTSLSSLNSLSLVLEQFEITTNKLPPHIQRQLEGAGRAVWGCVCEARKVLDACAVDYHKTTSKLEKLEEVVDDLKEKVAGEEQEKLLAAAAAGTDVDGNNEELKGDEFNDAGGDGTENLSENVMVLREKTKFLMTGRASCERKWRDSQLAFASILRSMVFNRGMTLLLRRELITKLRLEYELWCPLCEEFAVPGDQGDAIVMWYQPLNNLSQPISADHFRMCQEARSKMQLRILGFVPNTTSTKNLLYQNQNQMNSVAVNSFNQLSSSMGKLYQDVYFTADRIFQQREKIRSEVERLVGMCDIFPGGTKVAVFGSSANGFGSPKSDLDMCLQIPEGKLVFSDDDPTGSAAMASLAKILEENGMMDVDTSRLTARIPVIKFNSRRGTTIEVSSEEESLMECDLSMHNPLAVLNTALLRTYAEINPVPRVLAAVIKRWAKARDINNPARHTLSSYGYILMLLHFLTYHRRSDGGLVESLGESSPGRNSSPLLPNLQWMDDKWPGMRSGTPYCEFRNRPNVRTQHPFEESVKINAYFYRTNPEMMSNLQRLFSGQDLSLAILLASFFRYYAYEFDYKRNVVSLHSRYRTGLVEREVKAELDGWRNYSAALTIEDPFETFYDVAHVLRGGYYHRIRREFAMAYSKIADVALGKTSTTWNNKVVDLTNMDGMALIDWICEP